MTHSNKVELAIHDVKCNKITLEMPRYVVLLHEHGCNSNPSAPFPLKCPRKFLSALGR